MEETMYNCGTGISHELSHTLSLGLPAHLLGYLGSSCTPSSLPFPSLTNNCSARRKGEKDDGMKRREEEERRKG